MTVLITFDFIQLVLYVMDTVLLKRMYYFSDKKQQQQDDKTKQKAEQNKTNNIKCLN